MSSTWGPSRWTSARTGATTTWAASWRSRHRARRRRPIVSTLGLTRSKGSVSHAGKVSTASGPRNASRSCTSRSASPVVGTATTRGRRSNRCARAATVTARAASGTARVAERRPATWARAGSSRSRGGKVDRRTGSPGYRPPPSPFFVG